MMFLHIVKKNVGRTVRAALKVARQSKLRIARGRRQHVETHAAINTCIGATKIYFDSTC